MADLSLDDIIASQKGGSGLTVQFSKQNAKKPFQSKVTSRLGFKQGGIQQRRPFQGQGLKTNVQGPKGLLVTNKGAGFAGPGKGQIDARDMITIKNRIKIPDARAKIVQKRLNLGTFDARSKLKSGGQQQMRNARPQGQPPRGPTPQGPPQPQQLQNLQFQRPPQQAGMQRFPGQGPQQRPQQMFQPQGPQFNRQQAPPFNQPQRFNQPPQMMNQPRPNNFNQPPSQFNQPPSNFHQQPPNFQQVPAASGDLVNFTVAVNAGRQPPAAAAPLTRTLMNPLAGGGALVEDTGNSLKITRSVPDVTFDGQNLTITRRLSSGPSNPSNQGLRPGAGPRPVVNSNRGPVIQIRNDQYNPSPMQAARSGGFVRTRPADPYVQSRPRPPSPIQAPIPKRPTARPPVAAPAQAKPSPTAATAYATNTQYKFVKNVSAPLRTQSLASAQSSLLRSAPPARASAALPPKRPTQSALARIQMQASESAPLSMRLSSPGVSATKRLAPPPAAMPQQAPAVVRAGVKRKTPMSLSDRFGSSATGNPIPVITDHAPAKKRRAPQPEPEAPAFEEEFEVKEQFEEEEDDPTVPVLSPLQGFRIMVSNLHTSVTQDDIIELFGAIGALKRANLLGKGQAEVAFIHREHAVMALKKYHNRELDGQPMFVKVVTPLNAKVMKTPSSDDSPGLPPALRSKKPIEETSSAPVEIPLIHKALFKTGTETGPGKSVRFTVKL